MKTSLKSGNRFVRFVLAHGEKIGIVVIGACTALLIWSSLGRDHLGDDQQPGPLDEIRKSAVKKINIYTYDKSPENVQIDNERPLAHIYSGKAIKAINPDSFPPWPENMERPVITTFGPRADPLLLTATDLEVSSDSGLWALGDRETADQRRYEMITEAKKKEQERKKQLERSNRNNRSGRNNIGRPGGEDMDGGGGMGYGDNPYGGGRGNRDNAQRRTRQREEAVVMRPRAGVKLTGIEEVQEKSWVTVVARIPIQDQYQLYEDVLAKSSGYIMARDTPKYAGYNVERAEVTPAGQDAWEKLETIAHDALVSKMKMWPENPPKVVDPAVFHPILTYPLPPLLLRGWGEDVTHSTMPLAANRLDRSEEEPDESSEDETDENSDEEKDIFDDGSEDQFAGGGQRGMYGNEGMYGGGDREGMYGGGRGGEGMYGEGGMYGGGMMGEGMYGGEGMGEGMYGGGGEGMYGGGGEGMYGRGGEGMGFGMGYSGGYGRLRSDGAGVGQINLGSFQYNGKEQYLLLRYFDSRVQPGHQYVYRFRLVLKDVNNKIQEKHLDPVVVARRNKEKNKKYRFTDWSAQSPAIGVPLSGRVFVNGAELARARVIDDEPSAKLMVRALNTNPPAEIALVKSFSRGSVINTHEKAAVIWADRYNPEDGTAFDFLTGITLIDCVGGASLGRKDLNAPARALVMDSAGRLTVHSELTDRPDVEEFETTIAGSNNRRGGGYGGRPGGGEGMYGEGMYGEGMYGEGMER